MSGAKSPGIEYLKAEDFAKGNVFKEFDLEIKEAFDPGKSKSADGSLIDKPVVVFKNAKKRWIVSKTNRRLMNYATGSDIPADWVGKTIRLRVCILSNCLGQTNIATIRLALPDTGTKPFIPKKDYGMVATGMPMSAAQAAIAAEVDRQHKAQSTTVSTTPQPPQKEETDQ